MLEFPCRCSRSVQSDPVWRSQYGSCWWNKLDFRSREACRRLLNAVSHSCNSSNRHFWRLLADLCSFLSSQGRCYPFDAQANGYGRGEGVAAVLLKPLEAALKDGDNVRCVILGSSVNSDGRTPGITMPSVEAQIQVIRNAYEQAGVDPKETVYIEAHGKKRSAC